MTFNEYVDALVEKHGKDFDGSADPEIVKHEKFHDLWVKTDDRVVMLFMNTDSMAMLDDKIEVLTALIDGKQPAEIPKYYAVLENYPADGQIWD